MSRQLLCRSCGDDFDLGSADKGHGLVMRKLYVATNKPPEGHGITIKSDGKETFTPMDDLHCDGCNEVITGKVAVAITIHTWDRPVGDWEHEYGTVISKEVANLATKLGES